MDLKHKVTAVVLAVLALGWFFRYELVAPHSDSAAIYKLDRFTGTVYLIGGTREMEVKPKAPEN